MTTIDGTDRFSNLARAVMDMNPEDRAVYMSVMDPDERILVDKAVAHVTNQGWRVDPNRMALHLDPSWKSRRIQEVLATKFREGVDGSNPRQLWSIPSRIGKTSSLQRGVAWALDKNPKAKWIYVTNSMDNARDFGRTVRDLLLNNTMELSVRVRQGASAVTRWKTTEGGGLICASLGAIGVGIGAGDGGGIIVDDPLKGWNEAQSQHQRDVAWNTFTGTLRHRLDDEDCPIWVVHARWHMQDLTGRLLDAMRMGGEQWNHVSVPAISTAENPDDDALGRMPGEVIDETVFNLAQVQSRHAGMGAQVVQAIEQQDPKPAEGDTIRRSWFYIAEAGEIPSREGITQAISSFDLKLKNNEAGDYVVGQVWWRTGNVYWCVDQIRGKYDHATTTDAIALLVVRHPEISKTLIETAGSWDEVGKMLRKPEREYVVSDDMAARLSMTPSERMAVQDLRRVGYVSIEGIPAKGDKATRVAAHMAGPGEAGRIRVPPHSMAPWLTEFLDEMASFGPGATNDDQVDAASQALGWFARNESSVVASTDALTQSVFAGQPGRSTLSR